MTTLKDELRAITIGSKKIFRREKVKIPVFNYDEDPPKKTGEKEIELQQLTVKQRADAAGSSTQITNTDSGEAEFSFSAFQVWLVIFGAYAPGTDELLYDEVDFDELQSHPSGGWFDDLSTAAINLNNVTRADAEKNLEKTPTDSSSTP